MSLRSPRFKRYIDEDSGRAYIHDAETGETHWELPEGEWVSLIDKVSGRTFWYNKVTKHSQWENPTFRIVNKQGEQAAKDSTSQSGQSQAQSENENNQEWKMYVDLKTGRNYWYNATTRESSWTNPKNTRTKRKSSDKQDRSDDAISLGVHAETQWEKFWDPNTQRAFFFHRRLGVTQWERPSELLQWSPNVKHPAEDTSEQTSAAQIEQVNNPSKFVATEVKNDSVARNLFPKTGASMSEEANGMSPTNSHTHAGKLPIASSDTITQARFSPLVLQRKSVSTAGTAVEQPPRGIDPHSNIEKPNHADSRSKNPIILQEVDEVLLSGHLYEQIALPHSRREWKLRLFWLTSSGRLHCAASPQSKDSAHISIKDEVTTIREESDDGEFSLVGPFGKIISTFHARNREECKSWIESLSRIILETTTDLDGDNAARSAQPGKNTDPTGPPLSPHWMAEHDASSEQKPQSILRQSESKYENSISVKYATETEVSSFGRSNDVFAKPSSPSSDLDAGSKHFGSTLPVYRGNLDVPPRISEARTKQGKELTDEVSLSPSSRVTTFQSQGRRNFQARDAASPVDSRHGTVLERIFTQNESILAKYVGLQEEFRKTNYDTHKLKLENLVIRWEHVHNTPLNHDSTANVLKDELRLSQIGELWHEVRNHPEILSEVGNAQTSIEAQRLFATALTTSFLDPFSIPISNCLLLIMIHSLGTSFERPLNDALAAYREFRQFGKMLCEVLYQPNTATSMSEVLEFIAETLQNSCLVSIRAFGRGFLTSLVVTTLNSTRSQIKNSALAIEVMKAVEDRSDPFFESQIFRILEETPGFPQDTDYSALLPVEEWDVLVCSRFELFAFHSALSSFPAHALPMKVQETLKQLGPVNPLLGGHNEHPYVLIQHGARFLSLDAVGAQPERDFLLHVRGRIHALSNIELDATENDGKEEKALIREILALSEKARLETSQLEKAIKRAESFQIEFKTEQKHLASGIMVQPRFVFDSRPRSAISSPVDKAEPSKNPPPPPSSKGAASSPNRPISAHSLHSNDERRVRSEEMSQRYKATSPPSSVSSEYASKTRSQAPRPSSGSPNQRPWINPSNNRSFHS